MYCKHINNYLLHKDLVVFINYSERVYKEEREGGRM